MIGDRSPVGKDVEEGTGRSVWQWAVADGIGLAGSGTVMIGPSFASMSLSGALVARSASVMMDECCLYVVFGKSYRALQTTVRSSHMLN